MGCDAERNSDYKDGCPFGRNALCPYNKTNEVN